jgi:hypothetical protein
VLAGGDSAVKEAIRIEIADVRLAPEYRQRQGENEVAVVHGAVPPDVQLVARHQAFQHRRVEGITQQLLILLGLALAKTPGSTPYTCSAMKTNPANRQAWRVVNRGKSPAMTSARNDGDTRTPQGKARGARGRRARLLMAARRAVSQTFGLRQEQQQPPARRQAQLG